MLAVPATPHTLKTCWRLLHGGELAWRTMLPYWAKSTDPGRCGLKHVRSGRGHSHLALRGFPGPVGSYCRGETLPKRHAPSGGTGLRGFP
jgi:hypothetical protein